MINQNQRGGFSLVEMIVAVGVLAMIMVGLLAMFSQTSRALRASNNQTDVLETGRMMMEMMTREVQQASAAGYTNAINFYATRIQGAAPLNQRLAGGGTLGNDLEAFFLLIQENVDWKGIGYFVNPAENGIGTLYRFQTNSTVEGTPDFFDAFQTEVTLLPNSPSMHRVAEGVVHLEMHVYDADGARSTNGPGIQVANNTAAFTSNALPAFVEVEFAVVEPNLIERMRNMSSDVARGFLEDERRSGQVHIFRQRIPIQAAFAK